jgi:hypothetical protein
MSIFSPQASNRRIVWRQSFDPVAFKRRRTGSDGHQPVTLYHQHDPFLFARVGRGDDRCAGLRAGVEGQVSGVGGDVDQVTRPGLRPVTLASRPAKAM